MKRRLLVTAILLVAAGSALAEQDEDGFLGTNRLRNDATVSLYHEKDNGVTSYVEGMLSPPTARGNEVGTIMSFLAGHRAAFRMTEPSEELRPVTIDTDQLGSRHLRLQQIYQGIPVVGGELLAHFSAEGVLATVNGNFETGINLDVTPTVTSADAVSVAQHDLAEFFGAATPNWPELVVFPWEEEHRLCWRMFLYSDSPMGRWEYFVDARSGEVVYKANRIMNENDIGTGIGVMGDPREHIDTDFNGATYRMIDYTRQLSNNPHGHDGQMPNGNYIQTNIAGTSLPGSVATDGDNVWDNTSVQAPAVDGQVYTALMYDWVLREFNRNSYDNLGHSMLTSVNYSAEGDNNAYWNGNQIVVWSWSTGWRSLAGCPDVIAHEWGHAVTEYTSGLVYQKEPGALNESFSDMMGAAFEFAHDSMDTPDWLMGENGQIGGDGFRSMSDPHQFGDPDFYGTSDPYWIDVENCTPSWLNDYCGVHTNSGVGNKWFYLLSDGGTHHGVTVIGIGVENAIVIAYRANAFYWTSMTDYHEGALGTISAANDLDTTGAWALQVANAWNAVGVTTPGPGIAFNYPGGVPSMLSPAQPMTFTVVVSGSLGGVPVSGSGQLYYSVDDAPYTAVPMTETSPDQYDATLPPLTCSSRVAFYVSVDESATGTHYDPDTARPFTAVAATGTIIALEDDFETDQGWAVSGDASDGQWSRGIPVGGGDRGDPPTDFDGSGRCFLTDNVDGNSDVDGGTTILTSPLFDATGGIVKIHYARWYSNNNGNAPFSDTFKVYISNNNGGTWTLVERVGPVTQAAGGWYEHTFWVDQITAPTDQMRLRFEASDLGEGSVVEAAIDDVSVTVYECQSATPQIVTDSLPDWTVNRPYSQQLQATGGIGTLQWTDLYGNLVGTGLILSHVGLLSGIPVAPGGISFTARVVDDSLQTDDKFFVLFINDSLVITTVSLPDWTIGQSYTQLLQATGGTGASTWSDKNADLVGTGLNLSSEGVLSGSPSSTGAISFTATVSDVAGDNESRSFSFMVNAPVTISTDSLPEGTEGEPYSHQLQTTGGTGTKNWSNPTGDLAGTGLSLSAQGLLSGTPADTGLMSFTARAEDITGSQDEKVLTLTVVLAYICGDANGDESGPDVADLTYLVDYLFNGGPAPLIPEAANMDGIVGAGGPVDVSDVGYLVEYLFNGGPAPVCEG